jgi:hypothetical protein
MIRISLRDCLGSTFRNECNLQSDFTLNLLLLFCSFVGTDFEATEKYVVQYLRINGQPTETFLLIYYFNIVFLDPCSSRTKICIDI